MPLNVKIEKIEDTEAKIEAANATFARLKREFLADDGVIDAEERETLDRVESKISMLERTVSTLRAEVEENKRIWQGRSGNHSTLRDKVAALTAFGYPNADSFAGQIAGLPDAEADQRWADATALLDQIEAAMVPVWDDYELQKAAREAFEPLAQDAELRLAAAEVAEPQTEAISGPVGQIATAIAALADKVTAVNYVDALQDLRAALPELEAGEAEIARVQQAQADYQTALAALLPKLAECAAADFPSLAEDQAQIVAAQTRMEEAAAAHDYDTALTEQTTVSELVEACLARLAALREARNAYDSAWPPLAPRLGALTSADLGADASSQQEMLDAKGTVERAVEGDDYAAAVEHLPTLEQAIAAVEATIDARTLYEAREAESREDVAEALAPDERWAYLAPVKTELTGAKTEMQTSAGSGDYEAAVKSVSKVEGKLAGFKADIAAKKAEYEHERARLDTDLKLVLDHKPHMNEREPLVAAVARVDEAAAAEDWDKALNMLPGIEAGIARYHNEIEEYEKWHKDEIDKLLPLVDRVLANAPAGFPDRLKKVFKGKAKYDAEIKIDRLSKYSIAYVPLEAAANVAREIETINNVRQELGAVTNELRPDVAEKLVTALSEEDLARLPLAEQNMLIGELLENDDLTDEQNKAIQKVWKAHKMEPAFAEQEKQVCESMAKAMLEDPDMQYYATNWDSMDPSEKANALAAIAAYPTGPDGWDMDEFDHIETDPGALVYSFGDGDEEEDGDGHDHAHGDGDEEDESGGPEAGHYSARLDEMVVNIKGDEPFLEVVKTVVHEAGHKNQKLMLDRLRGRAEPPLMPGDVGYDQAVALALNEKYSSKHNEEWLAMVESDGDDDTPGYAITPEEVQSRTMEDELEALLEEAYGDKMQPVEEDEVPPEEAETP